MSIKRNVLGQSVRLLSVVVFMVGFMSAMGYATGNEILKRWTVQGAEMALNTAVCFCLLAIAIFLLTLNGGSGPFKEVV